MEMLKFMGLGIATIGTPVFALIIFFWLLGLLLDWYHWKYDKQCPHNHPKRKTYVFKNPSE